MKYLDKMITFREFPDEISLCLNITNCPYRCLECHSPELRKDIGTVLTFGEVDSLIKNNPGITLLGIMGGNPKEVNEIASYIKRTRNEIKVGWYSGDSTLSNDIDLELFDYIKLGPYLKEFGPLDSKTTNQKMYKYILDSKSYTIGNGWEDITYKFWKN